MSALSAAEAWCWVSYLHRAEATELQYRWPRTPDAESEALECEQRSDAAYQRAVSLDASDDLWRSAMDKWGAGEQLMSAQVKGGE